MVMSVASTSLQMKETDLFSSWTKSKLCPRKIFGLVFTEFSLISVINGLKKIGHRYFLLKINTKRILYFCRIWVLFQSQVFLIFTYILLQIDRLLTSWNLSHSFPSPWLLIHSFQFRIVPFCFIIFICCITCRRSDDAIYVLVLVHETDTHSQSTNELNLIRLKL